MKFCHNLCELIWIILWKALRILESNLYTWIYIIYILYIETPTKLAQRVEKRKQYIFKDFIRKDFSKATCDSFMICYVEICNVRANIPTGIFQASHIPTEFWNSVESWRLLSLHFFSLSLKNQKKINYFDGQTIYKRINSYKYRALDFEWMKRCSILINK